MERTKKKSNGLGIKEVISIILVAIFVILLIVVVTNIGKTHTVSNPNSTLRFNLKRGQYFEIYNEVHRCRRYDYKGDYEYAKYEAIADYYVAALNYNACAKLGSSKADEYKTVMDEQRNKMQDLVFAADDIDAVLTE